MGARSIPSGRRLQRVVVMSTPKIWRRWTSFWQICSNWVANWWEKNYQLWSILLLNFYAANSSGILAAPTRQLGRGGCTMPMILRGPPLNANSLPGKKPASISIIMNNHERGFPQHGNLGGNQKNGEKNPNISWILWRVYFYESHTSDVEDCCFRPNDPETNVGTVAPVNGAAPQKFVAWKLRDSRPSFFRNKTTSVWKQICSYRTAGWSQKSCWLDQGIFFQTISLQGFLFWKQLP